MSSERIKIRRRPLAIFGAVAAASLMLAACNPDAPGGGNNDGEGSAGTITLGYIESWTDGLSTAYLLANKLEEAGYTVEHQPLSEAGVLYTALAEGDIDVYPSAWPEVTHASYMEQYGENIEDLGAYYDNAKLTFAVPSYSEITSIADLPDYADALDNRIVGIEPGAGLTQVTEESVIPTYGLDDAGFSLVTSSTAAMVAELDTAIAAEDEIVVTLWRPFWANSTYDVRDLEDPEGALGEAEGLHFLAASGFSEEFPEVAEWISSIKLDDTQYGELENSVVNDNPDDPAAGVAAWLESYDDVVGSVG